LFTAGKDRSGAKTKAQPKFVIPSEAEGSGRETFTVTSSGSLDFARDDGYTASRCGRNIVRHLHAPPALMNSDIGSS
jgi:hypothetical protein